MLRARPDRHRDGEQSSLLRADTTLAQPLQRFPTEDPPRAGMSFARVSEAMVPSKHERLAAWLDRSGALAATLHARAAFPVPSLSVVTFHRLADPAPSDPFDPDVVDATPDQFRRQLELLSRHGTPIGLEALLAAFEGQRLPPNPLLVTFDDGYRSCVDVALPILLDVGVPATFFIATAFPGAGRLYWWEKVSAIVRRARRRVATLSYPHELRLDAGDPNTRRAIDDLIKNTAGLDVDRLLDAVCEAFDVAWDPAIEASHARSVIMGWDDIRTIAAAGMDVESHTRWHRVLETLDARQLRDELVGSRHDLETALGRPVRAISYPVGRPPPAHVRRAVAEAGYRVGFTNVAGSNLVWPRGLHVDRFALHRQSAERTRSDALFLTQLALPVLGY